MATVLVRPLAFPSCPTSEAMSATWACQLPGDRPSLRPSTASCSSRSSLDFSLITPAWAAARTPAATPARAPLLGAGGAPSAGSIAATAASTSFWAATTTCSASVIASRWAAICSGRPCSFTSECGMKLSAKNMTNRVNRNMARGET
ncbi:hypothetical protein D3C86_1645680 [compost metagenome]